MLCLSLIISKDRLSWQETFDNYINKGSLWTIKKAKHRRIDAFELWCLEKTLESPLDSRRSNQSILKEINPEYLLEGLMLKLELQYFGPT